MSKERKHAVNQRFSIYAKKYIQLGLQLKKQYILIPVNSIPIFNSFFNIYIKDDHA